MLNSAFKNKVKEEVKVANTPNGPAIEYKGISVILYGSEIGTPAIQREEGTDIIIEFIKKVREGFMTEPYSFGVFQNFNMNRVQFITSKS